MKPANHGKTSGRFRGLVKLPFGRGYHVVRREPEFLLQLFEGRRGPKRFHADDLTGQSRIASPSKCRGLFHADSCRHVRRNHAVAISLWLMFEQLSRGHAHHAGLNAFCLQPLGCLKAERHFTAACEEQHVPLLSGPRPPTRRRLWPGQMLRHR